MKLLNRHIDWQNAVSADNCMYEQYAFHVENEKLPLCYSQGCKPNFSDVMPEDKSQSR